MLYFNLLTSGKLYEHLAEIDTSARDMVEYLIKEMAKKQGVTEELLSNRWQFFLFGKYSRSHEVVSIIEVVEKLSLISVVTFLWTLLTRKLGMCIIKICKENLAWRCFYEKGRNLKCKQKRTSQ